jgi:glyoxylase-like metal-dependent hydrolase (beta-lactamase superfamily II)
MAALTRRSLLAGAAVAGAGTMLWPRSAPVRAAAPAVGKQAPGFYRYKVGELEITQFADGARTFPMPDAFVVNASKDQAIAAAEAAYMPTGQVTVPFNPMIINTGSKLIAIDTGNGLGAFAASKGAVGQMQSNIAAAGIDPKAVDIVLISHMHGDHVGGLRTAEGALAFPNAEIKVSATEWAFWMNDENMSKANPFNKAHFPTARKPFEGIADKVTRYEAGKEVAPGITSIATPGHTPGHTSFAVASGSARILVQSDVTNIPQFFLRNPDWHVSFDNEPDVAAATRHKFYDMAAAEKATVVGYHFPFPSVGHVEKDGAGYRLVPIAWNPVL